MSRKRSKSLSELDKPFFSPFYYWWGDKCDMYGTGTVNIKGARLYTDMGPFREGDVVDLQFDTISSEGDIIVDLDSPIRNEDDMIRASSRWRYAGLPGTNCYVSGVPEGFTKRICVSFNNTTKINCVGIEDSDEE